MLAFLPVIPGLQYLFHTSKTHVYDPAPNLADLVFTLVPPMLMLCFCGVGFLALLVSALKPKQHNAQNRLESWHILLCASLALIPILILYGVSVGTPMHVFTTVHRLDAVPGIALCWALIFSCIDFRILRLLFCVALVMATAFVYLNHPTLREHGYAWKYALDYAEKNAITDEAPVVICSDFPEADYTAMPLDSAKDSALFVQLSYYKLSVPVVPLPRALNDEAIRVGSRFLQESVQKHERFLALANEPSYKTLNWLAQNAAATHYVRKLGVFDGVEVLEFVPRTDLAPSGNR